MVRNLVSEKKERDKVVITTEPNLNNLPVMPEPPQNHQVKVITFEEAIMSNMVILDSKLDRLIYLVEEGFKQVGVIFPQDTSS